jgi:hypothetical protein
MDTGFGVETMKKHLLRKEYWAVISELYLTKARFWWVMRMGDVRDAIDAHIDRCLKKQAERNEKPIGI